MRRTDGLRVDSPWTDAQRQNPNLADIRISVYRTEIRQKVTEFPNFNDHLFLVGYAVSCLFSSSKVYGWFELISFKIKS